MRLLALTTRACRPAGFDRVEPPGQTSPGGMSPQNPVLAGAKPPTAASPITVVDR